MSLESFYLSCPTFIQQVMIFIYGFYWYRRRYSKHFKSLVRQLSAQERWTIDKFNEYQTNKLKEILLAASNSDYYSNIFQKLKISTFEQPLSILERMPVLSKAILQTNARALLTCKKLPRGTVIFKSSGTTGTPTQIYYTPYFHAFEVAIAAMRSLKWAGVDYRERRVMFGARKICHFNQKKPPFWRYSPIENMAYASIYHLSLNNLPYYIEFLHKYRPAIVMGYPNSLMTIAQYCLEENVSIPPAKGVFTTSETLTEQIRYALEKVWQCKVYDRYGAVENCVFASQCEYGNYHVSPEAGILEIIDEDGNPCEPGVDGQIICTGLQNTLQPLIRYRIGDIGRWAKNQNCLCGRQMPIIEGISGRYEDICVTKDGRKVLRFDTVFKGVPGIKEAQISQESADHFIIKIVPARDFSGDIAKLLVKNMKQHVGNLKIEVVTVAQIKRTDSGKFKAVVCKLSEEEKEKLFKR